MLNPCSFANAWSFLFTKRILKRQDYWRDPVIGVDAKSFAVLKTAWSFFIPKRISKRQDYWRDPVIRDDAKSLQFFKLLGLFLFQKEFRSRASILFGIKKSLPNSKDLSGWQDSNLRPPAPKAGAITELRYTPKRAQRYNYFFLIQVISDLWIATKRSPDGSGKPVPEKASFLLPGK